MKTIRFEFLLGGCPKPYRIAKRRIKAASAWCLRGFCCACPSVAQQPDGFSFLGSTILVLERTWRRCAPGVFVEILTKIIAATAIRRTSKMIVVLVGLTC